MWVGVDLQFCAGWPDPYPSMVNWVKRCCFDSKPQTWTWDSEDVYYLFTYIQMSNFLRIESLDWGESPVLLWSGNVTITELHRAFYQGFLRFVGSQKFEPLLWCSYTLGEWLDWFLGGRDEELVEQWIRSDQKRVALDLASILNCDLEWRRKRFPGIDVLESEWLEWRNGQAHRFPIRVPEGWDQAPDPDRRILLKTLFEEGIGGDEAHPRGLRSERLDSWFLEEMGRISGDSQVAG